MTAELPVGHAACLRVPALLIALFSFLLGAEGAAARGSDSGRPHILITSPVNSSSYLTDSDTLSLAGRATGSPEIVRVTWMNDQGGSGEATGTDSWSVAVVPLVVGLNTIAVTAYDATGRDRTDTIAVTRSAPAAEPPADNTGSETTTLTDTVAPEPPAGLQAAALSTSQIKLGWGAAADNVGVVSYRLQRCQGAGCGDFRDIGTAPDTGYSDAGLLSGTSYSYRVQATDAAGNVSDFSDVSSAATVVPEPVIEPAPEPVTEPVPEPVTEPVPVVSEPPPTTVIEANALFVAGAQANASDSNPGTEAAPWKTMAYAASKARAGDTVYIKAGLYTGAVNFANSGESGKEIVFRAYPGDERRAILDGAGITIKGKSYIQVRGLKIQNAPSRGVSVEGPDDWRAPPVRFITLADNHFYNTYSSAISVWGVRWGIDPGDYENATDIVIEGNLIEKAVNGGWNECITVANGVLRIDVRNNELRDGGDPVRGGEGIDFKEGVRDSLIRDNYIHGLSRRAIYIDGGQQATALTGNIYVYGNVVKDDPGDAIFVMSEGAGDVDGVYLYNNLVVGARRNGMGIYQHPNGVGIGTINDVQFVNNTVLYGGREGTGWGGIGVNMPAATNILIRNNIALYGNGFDIKSNADTRIDHNLCRNTVCEYRGEPMFFNPTLDPASWDYRLKSGSPAIDRGSSAGAPADDLDGTARPQGAAVDLGAYEYIP